MTTQLNSRNKANGTRWASTTAGESNAGREAHFGSGNISSLAYHFKRQRHLPYFLEYLMWVVFGSEALQLIWLKMERKEYEEKTEHKIRLLKEIVERIEKGQEFNDDFREEIRMVLLNGGRPQHDENDEEIDDDYLDKLIASSEASQQQSTTPAPNAPKSEESEQLNWPPIREEGGEKKKFFL
ncbi:hypothetical protein INT45_005237 [Circinella minor]|uniref:Uncharacterized protein n=1 Tax=Circinella minor TaxID=1195481 RepID=A0A8H7S220_9FUNG|nr:hypothetical protein INT45_005237 [Circinella minor]